MVEQQRVMMSDDDKPFVCHEHGCRMKFTNEDHLSVHMRKHDMSLALNLTSQMGGLSPMGLFTDQTPTPTKFLRNCEEIGLFQELSKNPFDYSFKKAMDDPMDQTGEESSIPIPGPGVLDTPQLPVPKIYVGVTEINEQLKTLDKIRDRADSSLSSIVPKKRKKYLTQSMPTSTTSEDEEEQIIGSSSVEVEVPRSQPLANKGDNSPATVSSSTLELTQSVIPTTVQEPKSTTVPMAQAPMMMQVYLQLPGGQTIPVQVPATTLTPQQQQVINPQHIIQLNPGATSQAQVTSNVFQNIPQVVLPGTQQIIQTIPGNLPTSVMQKIVTQGAGTSTTNLPLNVRTITLGTSPQAALTGIRTFMSQSNPVISQSSLKTDTSPQSQTGSPTAVVMSLRNHAIQPSSQNVITMSSRSVNTTPRTSHSGSQSYTKQRLKAALQQQTTPSSSQKISQIFQMVSQVKRETHDSPVSMDAQSVVSSPGSVSSPEDRVPSYSYGAQNMMDFDPSDDPEARRKKFLERNRAAAARCRQKRKHWVVNLESKADELTQMNNKLSSDIKALRGEVAQLKTLLLAHKECPVTLQQKSQGQITPQTYVIEHPPSEHLSMEQDMSTSVNGMMLPNIITIDQTSQQSASPGSISDDMIPITIDQSNTISAGGTSFVPSFITIDQSNHQTYTTVSVGDDHMVPNIITIDAMEEPAAEVKHMGVITGPNSIAMIPKIINMENLLKTSEGHRS